MQLSALATRQPFGGDVRSPFGSSPIGGLSSKYHAMADDANSAREDREAAMLLKVADGFLREWRVQDCIDNLERAIQKFKDKADYDGEADALSLMVSAQRLEAEFTGTKPVKALETAKSGLSRFDSVGNKRGIACMRLAVADLKCSMPKVHKHLLEAEEDVARAIDFFATNGDRTMHAKALLVSVSLNCQRRQQEATLKAANAALAISKQLNDDIGEARSLHGIALSHSLSEDYEKATHFAKQALEIYKRKNSQMDEAFELRVISLWYMLGEKPLKALKPAKDSLAAIRGFGVHRRSEAVALLLYIEVLIQNFKEKQALKEAQAGLARFRELGDDVGIASGLEVLLYTHVFLNSPDEALAVAKDAKDFAKRLGDRRSELNVLYASSNIQMINERHQDAVDSLNEAINVARTINDTEEEAEAHRMLSIVYLTERGAHNNQQKLDDGRKAATKARKLFEELRYKGGVASTAIAEAYADFLSPATTAATIDAVEAARVLYQEAEDPVGEGHAINMMTQFQVDMGEIDDAIATAEAHVAHWIKYEMKREQLAAMQTLASLQLRGKYLDDAEEQVRSALRLSREIGAKGLEGKLMLLLTQVLVAIMAGEEIPNTKQVFDDDLTEDFLRARKDARDTIKDALVLSQRSGDAAMRASVLFWRSEFLVWSFRRKEALESALEAESSFTKINDEKGEAHTRVLLADLHLALGKTKEAKEAAEKALEFAKSSLDGLEVEGPAQSVLDKIAEQERRSRPARRAGGRTKLVRQKVKKFRKKDGSGGAVAKSAGLDVAVISGKLAALVKEILVDDEENVEQDVPFMEAGIDSLGSVQLVTDIGKEFKMAMAPSVMFDFPTIRALSDHLSAEIGSAESGAAGGGGDDEWEEYEDWEDVEVPDDDDGYDDFEPVQAVATVAKVEASAAVVATPAKPALDADMVKAKVLEMVNEVLVDEGGDYDTPFMEAGIDSLGSVQLVTDVGKAFSMNLAPSVMFDFPTIRALSDHLVAESGQ